MPATSLPAHLTLQPLPVSSGCSRTAACQKHGRRIAATELGRSEQRLCVRGGCSEERGMTEPVAVPTPTPSPRTPPHPAREIGSLGDTPPRVSCQYTFADTPQTARRSHYICGALVRAFDTYMRNQIAL